MHTTCLRGPQRPVAGRLAAGLAAALAIGLAWPAAAQRLDAAGTALPSSAPPTERAELDSSATDRALAETRATVRLAAEGLARGVDSWFGDKPFEDGGQVTHGRLSVRLLSRQHEPLDSSVRFHARWRLPNLGAKSYLYLGQGDRQEVIKDQPESLARGQFLQADRASDNGFFAGLGLTLREVFELRLGFRGGLKPYAQASYKHLWQLTPQDQVRARETLFWTLDDHVGSTTALSYEHALSPRLSLRWLNAATITQRARHIDWSSSLGAYQSFGQERLLSVEALMSGTEGSGVGVSDYGLQARWQQPVHRDWLIGEVLVGHFWPRKAADQPRLRAWAAGAGLTLKF